MYISANYGDDQQTGLLSHDKSANTDTWTVVSFDFKTLLLWTGAAPEMLTKQSFLDLAYKYTAGRNLCLFSWVSVITWLIILSLVLGCIAWKNTHKQQTKNTHKQQTKYTHKQKIHTNNKQKIHTNKKYTQTTNKKYTQTKNTHKQQTKIHTNKKYTQTTNKKYTQTKNTHKQQTKNTHKQQTKNTHKQQTKNTHKQQTKNTHKQKIHTNKNRRQLMEALLVLVIFGSCKLVTASSGNN